MRKRTIIFLVAVAILFLVAGGAYLSIALYYDEHFLENTRINGINVSDLTAGEAEALVAAKVEDYDITVTSMEGTQEKISGADIGYRYVPGDEIQGFLRQQNLFAWPAAFLGDGKSYDMEASVVCDEGLLRKAMEGLACMQEENVTKPRDAYIERKDGSYVIVPEVEGNELDEEKVYGVLLRAANGSARSVNLKEQDCYLAPTVRQTDGDLKAEAALMNKYTSITVTYQMGDGQTTVLDGETIAGWFSLDDQKNPVFDRDAVAAWVGQLADQYDTIGTFPPFVTSKGETVWVEARTYGWQIDREGETEALYQILLDGNSTEHTPVYCETAYARGENDIGDTYVEIDYTNQRMWYYKNGQLLVETPVVTGNTSQGMGSPEGIFCIVDKQQNAVLKGEGYSTPVSYWMPFYGGVGIHDADSWRTSYGGTIYQYGGSHGCINTPTAQAATIYQNIDVGTPVVCYSSTVNYGYGEVSTGGSVQGNTGQQGGEGQAGGNPQSESQPGGSTQSGDGSIVILDGGGDGSSDVLGDWADESVYYFGNEDITVIPENAGQ